MKNSFLWDEGLGQLRPAVEAHDLGLDLAALVLVELVDAADGVGRRRGVLEVDLSDKTWVVFLQSTLETQVVTHVVSDAVHVGRVLAAAAAGGGGGDVGHLRKITSDLRPPREDAAPTPSLSFPLSSLYPPLSGEDRGLS